MTCGRPRSISSPLVSTCSPPHITTRLSAMLRPDEFEKYRQWGLEKGFLEVVSGVFVRSSYRAEQVLLKNNVGLA